MCSFASTAGTSSTGIPTSPNERRPFQTAVPLATVTSPRPVRAYGNATSTGREGRRKPCTRPPCAAIRHRSCST